MLIVEATAAVSANATLLIRAALLPAVGILLVDQLAEALVRWPMLSLVVSLSSLPLYVIVAIIIHRAVILGPAVFDGGQALQWKERETRFMWLLLGIWLIAMVFVFSMGLVLASFRPMDPTGSMDWLGWEVAWFATSYIEARVGLALAATAVDRQMNFNESSAMTRGRGLLIAVALYLPSGLQTGLEAVMYREVDEQFVPIVDGISMLLFLVVFSLQVAILSIAYMKLRR